MMFANNSATSAKRQMATLVSINFDSQSSPVNISYSKDVAVPAELRDYK